MFHLFWQNWQPHENVLNSDRMSRPLSFYFPSSSLKFAHNGFIWRFRYFWSTWLPSGYVPSGWAIQTLLRPQQSWSGGLHKLLSVSAQVGGIKQTRFFALCLCVQWCLDCFSLTVRNWKSRAWCQSWLIWGMPHTLPSVSLSSLYCCLRYCYDEVECVATLWDLFKMMVYYFILFFLRLKFYAEMLLDMLLLPSRLLLNCDECELYDLLFCEQSINPKVLWRIWVPNNNEILFRRQLSNLWKDKNVETQTEGFHLAINFYILCVLAVGESNWRKCCMNLMPEELKRRQRVSEMFAFT